MSPRRRRVVQKPVSLDAHGVALRAAEAACAKKASEVLVLDVRELSTVADFLVLAGARSPTQMHAISAHVEEALAKRGQRCFHKEEGGPGGDSDWILLDYFDVMVHVMQNEARAYYQLENLYPNAQRTAF